MVGPQGFTTTTEKFDFRVGGEWRHVMLSPNGTEFPNHSVFLEIVRPERIVRTHGGGKKGEPDSVSAQMTVTFAAEGNKTRLTMRTVFPTVEMYEFVLREHHAIEGGKQTLARLAQYLAKPESVEGYVLHISRVFEAPRDLVYKAFTDPAMLAGWMGPRGFDAEDIEQDLRVGGKWRLSLVRNEHDPACDSGGAPKLWQNGVYREIVPPERLVYTFSWENRVDIPTYETTITVTFRELEGKTVMDFKQGPFDSAAERDGHNIGWSSAFDRFAEFILAPTLPKEPAYDLVIDRVFDAPRDLVWKVWTDPTLAAEWAGPRGFTATHFEQDARVGGKWRLCLHSDGFDTGDGQLHVLDLWQGGVFREIVPPERIVYTFAWENRGCVGLDPTPHKTVITVLFKEQGSKTAMTFRQSFFTTIGERDGHNGGWSSAFDRFGELLQTVQTKARA
jgi:uncharacterized protein YndB with AHSA1/START domain